MTGIRSIFLLSLSFAFVLLLAGPVMGQFKETYEPPGSLLEWGSSGSSNGQFSLLEGIALDASGNVYVADTGNDRIQKFDSDGNYLTQWGASGSGNGQFNLPVGIAADASGNIYVADTFNTRIQKFDSDGNYLTQWGVSGSGNGQFNNPYGVAVDTSGHVYVADTGNNRIQKFDNSGNYVTEWGTFGTSPGQFYNPTDVDTDTWGNVYVADTSSNRIQKFDGAGNYLTEWGASGSGSGQFNNPAGVAVDTSGYVYVADTDNNRIQKFDSAGNYVTEWGVFGTNPSQFRLPKGVAVDTSSQVYVADRSNYRVQKFAPALWFDVAGYDSYLSVATLHETTAVRTLFRLENNGAPRFAFKNNSSDIEWSFQQSGPGNFLISKEGTGGPEMQVYQTGMVRMGPGVNRFTLYPNGNLVIAGSLTANGSTFPDYVFEPDYGLMPLSDLRSYIQTAKRLPDIPSAEEVKQQGGHNMTALQLKLLEKIEELTLYTLEQEKKLQEAEVLKLENVEMKEAQAKQRKKIQELEGRLAAIEAVLSGHCRQ